MSAGRRTPLDWDAARDRLERSRLALEQAFSPGAEFTREVFSRRAERLARAAAETAIDSGQIRVLLFLVGGERYAMEIAQIAEAIVNAVWSPVPGAPPRLRGVIQVHGEICPVWDLARLLGLSEAGGESSRATLVLRRPGRLAAVAVDTIEDIRVLRRTDFAPAPGNMVLVQGIDSNLVALLDAEEIMKETAR